jgi:hypothetical protein
MGDLKPGRIFRPDLSQQWYFTARYRDHGHGQFEAITKHPVENSAELKAGHQAPRQLQRLAELVLTDITRRLRADQQVTHDAAALTPMSRLVRGDIRAADDAINRLGNEADQAMGVGRRQIRPPPTGDTVNCSKHSSS